MKIKSINGILYKEYWDTEKGYTRRQSLKMRATKENKRIAERNLFEEHHPNLILLPKTVPYLTDTLDNYFTYKQSKPKTRLAYSKAADHLIEACGNKRVDLYTHQDYVQLLRYFRQPKKIPIDQRRKEKKKFRIVNYSSNSVAFYTRHLFALFNYFIKQKWIQQNPIEVVKYTEKVPRPVPQKVIDEILKQLKEKDAMYYNYTYFLLHTGIRASAALQLQWEDIDWQNGIIIFRNLKVKDKEYTFPLKPLEELFRMIGVKKSGKIFPYKNIDSVKFFRKIQDKMKLDEKYGIHKLKHTFISRMVDEGISLEDLSILTNTSLSTLRKHYWKPDIQRIGERLTKVQMSQIS